MNNENKMRTMAVNKLLIITGIPIILSMMLQAFYNIVDSAFVSNMSENGEFALNALTLAFPVQMMIVAVSIGTGVGANALLSKCLGQNDKEQANKTTGNAIFLAAIIYVFFLIFGIVGVEPYISSQTSNPIIYEMAVDYLRICCVISFGMVFFAIFEKLLQAAGHSLYSTIAQVSGAVVNIILDPILIYGLLGFPELGVSGAAYATVIGQIVALVMTLFFYFKFCKETSKEIKYLKPSKKIIKRVYSIGLPAIIAQLLMSVMTYGLNIIFGNVNESAVTAYGLYYKIQQFILFAAFGLRDAITPIVSFSYGMKNEERIKEGIKYGIIYTLAIMFIGMALVEALAYPLSEIFDLSESTRQLCISAIRIISLSFIFAGANISFQGIFQALDGGKESLIISVCRQLIFIFPIAWAFSLLASQYYKYIWTIWLTFPIAEIISVIIAIFLMKKVMKNTFRYVQYGKSV